MDKRIAGSLGECAPYLKGQQLSVSYLYRCSTQVPVADLLSNTYSKVVGVTCSPRDSRYAGLNQAEVDGFFQDVKILSTSPPGGTLS